MEPQIRYVRAPDGVTIAYYDIGEGAPLVVMDMPYSHLLSEWRSDPRIGGTYHVISRTARLIRYDHRTFGLSERDVADISLDAFVSDLEAVVDKLELPPFDLLAGRGPTTPIAVSFVARHPERVRHLVLFNASLTMPPMMRKEMGELLALESADWKFVSESISRLVQGWDDDASSKGLAALLRDSTDLAGFRRWFNAYASWNAEHLLPRVPTPTLVTANQTNAWFGDEQARPVAALLADAQMFLSDGTTSAERDAQVVEAVARFLGVRQQTAPPPPLGHTAQAGTAIILFADIVESTAIMARVGNVAFRERTLSLEDSLRSVIHQAGGSPVEGRTLGDGVLGIFTSAAQAIAAALQCGQHAARVGLQLHLGIHAGDVLREGGDVSGIAVSMASRKSDLSAPNEILASSTVRDLARAATDVTFEDRGEHTLKGIAEPQRVFAVTPNEGDR